MGTRTSGTSKDGRGLLTNQKLTSAPGPYKEAPPILMEKTPCHKKGMEKDTGRLLDVSLDMFSPDGAESVSGTTML